MYSYSLTVSAEKLHHM